MVKENGDGKNMEKHIMRKYAGIIFWVSVLAVPVLLVSGYSWWSLNFVLVVVGVLVAL